MVVTDRDMENPCAQNSLKSLTNFQYLPSTELKRAEGRGTRLEKRANGGSSG
jgi:hypothetical protein